MPIHTLKTNLKFILSKNKKIVFTLRYHRPKYGIEYLIKAIPFVSRENEDVFFVIGGDFASFFLFTPKKEETSYYYKERKG